jgi:hypothetical protein
VTSGIEEDRPGLDLADLEEGLVRPVVSDVLLEAPDHVSTVALAAEGAPAVEEAGVEQLHERGEVGVVAVVWRGSEKEEAIGLAGEHLGQPAPA